MFTLAKGVAGGVACGALVARDEIASALKPGTHASTFGGNPIAMAAGLATIQTIEDDGLLEHSKQMSQRFHQRFLELKAELPIIRELRVMGMMIGADLTIPALPAVAKCMERKVLINATHDTVIRLLPALNITPAQVDEGFDVVADVLREMAAEVK